MGTESGQKLPMTLQNWGEPEWVPGHTWGHITLCFGGLAILVDL